MSRRNPRSPVLSGSSPNPRPRPRATDLEPDGDEALALRLGEILRRVALGATAALLTARALWPSEPHLDFDDGGAGMSWVLALWIVGGLAVASALIGGTFRFRWSLADTALVVLVALVGMSTEHAVDRRPAINLAWEWGSVGLAYVLLRTLPRTREESTALMAGLAATAVAVAMYGLYQAGVEIPEMQQQYRTNAAYKARALAIVGVRPGTPAQAAFENRLLGSNEAYATFGLPNSLAGYLVGPLVVMLAVGWNNLTRREGRGSRWGALLVGAVPAFATLVCLILTKSRSAWIGLAAALLVLAWRERRLVSRRTLLLGAGFGLLVAVGLAAAGLATGRLDLLVLTESGKSFRYRREYWVGAWQAINETRATFWGGYGPGNFRAAYVRHKLPEASEEIADPHNLLLEVWAIAGAWGAAALVGAVMFGLWNMLGPAKTKPGETPPKPDALPDEPSAPPRSTAWLVAAAGGLGWMAVRAVSQTNVFTDPGEFLRWLILGVAWIFAVFAGMAAWQRRSLDPAALGAGALAVFINLTAAGGIGIPAVALAVWTLVALGQNLRDDRPCGRLREVNSRIPSFAAAALWAALMGTFVGAVGPYWKAEAAIAEARDALESRPPNFEKAEKAYDRAKEADKYSARPWLAAATLQYDVWQFRGAKEDDLRWRKIPIEMYKAVSAPRTPLNWTRHRERARMTSLLLKQLGSKISPIEVTRYRADVVQASRTASQLYPTNASLHAWLAEASADIGMIPDAVKEGTEALRLDALTPHADKKLDPEIRVWLTSNLPAWEKSAAANPDALKLQGGESK